MSLFVYHRGSMTSYMFLYVDDIILTTSPPRALSGIITTLCHEFDMKYLGVLHDFLGTSVTHKSSSLFMYQHKYLNEIMQRANMSNCNPCTTPSDTKMKLFVDSGPSIEDPTMYRSLAEFYST